MKWTVWVPGGLLPQALAPEILGAARAAKLEGRLGAAREQGAVQAGPRSAGAAHWSWLASSLGLDEDPPVTAPYAWQALAPAGSTGPAGSAWVAHCDPVCMEVGRDRVRVIDLAEDPLDPEESAQLLALANDAAAWMRGRRDSLRAGAPRAAPLAPAELPSVRFEVRGGHWFLVADEPVAVQTHALDAVLGRSIQECLPAGEHARELRVLSNEIQMLWHASPVSAAREQRGSLPVNALWIHGGGAWRALRRPLPARCLADAGSADAAILLGWQTAAPAGSPPPGGALTAFRGLFRAYALGRWDDWLAGLEGLEACVEDCAAQAQGAGGRELELVLCGHGEARTFALPLGAAHAAASPWSRWTRRLLPAGGRAAEHGAAPWLRCLSETAPGEQPAAGAAGVRA
jgi:hypothetical protein